jgi:hypothetical protein
MNRRSIFKTIAGALCAAAIEVCGVEPSLPKARKVVINPEWLSAEYEDVFISQFGQHWVLRKRRLLVDGKDESSQWTNRDKGIFAEQVRRLNLIDNQYVEVYPYIFEA